MIDGRRYEHFGNISISHSLSGYGTSGVVTSIMTVSTYNPPYISQSASQNAEVVLTCSGAYISPPMFFVTGRDISGNVTKWTCADRMSKTESTMTFTDSEFTNDRILCNTVLAKISDKCGFNGISGLKGLTSNYYLDREDCENHSSRNILEMLSEALVGYWMTYNDVLVFVPFGQFHGAQVDVTKYTEVIPCGTKDISCIMMSDGDNIYTAGSGNLYQTISIDTKLASSDFARSALEDMGTNYTYAAWRCDKGMAMRWVYIGAIYFTDGMRICNSVTLYPSPAGLFFTASSNKVIEDEATYIPALQRQLQKKIEMDRVNGNTSISKKGLYFFENGYKEKKNADPAAVVKYGFDVADGGVTKYSGAMVDSVMPDSITFDAAATSGTIAYQGKVLALDLEWDGNDNLIGIKQTEVE